MSWFDRLKILVHRWLEPPDDDEDRLAEYGLQRVFLMGTDGQHYVAIDQVGWWVEEEGRCWRFAAPLYDEAAWPVLGGALLGSVLRAGQLPLQYAIRGNQCWMSDETLVLYPCTGAQLLESLTTCPLEWEVVAKHLGLGVIRGWAQ
jgi:hypothetical protein